MRRSDAPLLRALSTTVVRVILLAYSLVVSVPFIWTVYSSFKTSREFLENPWSLPTQLYLMNYYNAFIKGRVGDYFFNSILVAGVTLLIGIVLSLMTAYAITRFVNLYTRILKSIYLAAFLIPSLIGLIPLYLFMSRIRMIDNRIGLVLVYVSGTLAFSIYVLSAFLATLPKDYEESAFIDGCSRLQILARIVAPMSRTAIVTVTIFNFIGVWNEYITSLTLISSDFKRTLPVGIANLMEVQRYRTDWGALFAGLVIVMVPTLVFYSIFQRKITSGLSTGGLKM